MRYTIRKNTLFIRGRFKAASTGIKGGISEISTVINHTVPRDFNHLSPDLYLKTIIEENGYEDDFFGLLTAVEMKNLCVFSYDYITVFITAGVSNPNPKGPNTINIIIHSREALSDGALLEMIITATEAKSDALFSMGYDFTGTTTDEVAVLYDIPKKPDAFVHEYAGTLTDCGSMVYTCVKNGVPEAIKRHEDIIPVNEPSFFIFSTRDGVKMNLWQKEGCKYYPCHFKGQRCDLCYCPFYPCSDENLGEWILTSSEKKVWSCKRCLLNHYPKIVRYIKNNPDAELSDVKKTAAGMNLKLTE
ncbi:MAG: adenosylcobinamide amidohydrolase [Methanomicrobiaceae archaeon]|nr:adenosylcobinamide amidohydrolase [Methanomicrobiaceae archaeon]